MASNFEKRFEHLFHDVSKLPPPLKLSFMKSKIESADVNKSKNTPMKQLYKFKENISKTKLNILKNKHDKTDNYVPSWDEPKSVVKKPKLNTLKASFRKIKMDYRKNRSTIPYKLKLRTNKNETQEFSKSLNDPFNSIQETFSKAFSMSTFLKKPIKSFNLDSFNSSNSSLDSIPEFFPKITSTCFKKKFEVIQEIEDPDLSEVLISQTFNIFKQNLFDKSLPCLDFSETSQIVENLSKNGENEETILQKDTNLLNVDFKFSADNETKQECNFRVIKNNQNNPIDEKHTTLQEELHKKIYNLKLHTSSENEDNPNFSFESKEKKVEVKSKLKPEILPKPLVLINCPIVEAKVFSNFPIKPVVKTSKTNLAINTSETQSKINSTINNSTLSAALFALKSPKLVSENSNKEISSNKDSLKCLKSTSVKELINFHNKL